ncbi:efflux RND transporter periplasmic adaptor subunit [Marivita sp. GX14005]|uniref:efflux RND transporter periplasmic adaptor subunit n=1 Tax=Marivita sp. GX14005 TaxID=2942276 RepID=UPI0020190417|nr:efflux RND transporter periplasmic adaptor subunit [Marivita sp. GX14005]MCL3883139.1 efflux RND transporter periplasmic adaptor subunit [Marivita sp. GX14005]
MIKRLVIAIILLAAIAGGVIWFNLFRDNMIAQIFSGRTAPAVPVATVEATPGEWVPALEAIGTIYAARGIELSVEAGGVVEAVNFEGNDKVEEGQILVRISDSIELAQKNAAEARANLARQSLDRVQSLGERGVAADASVQEAQANLSAATADVERIQAQIDQKVIRAPFSGEIGIPEVEIGEFVAPGAPIATLQDLSMLRVEFSLPEQQRPRLSIGQSVTVTSEEGVRAEGRITAIEPRIDPVTRLVSVRAELENPQGRLNPGQFVRVRIALPAQDGVIALPQTAVVTSLYGDYVYAVRPAEDDSESLVARQVFVRTGLRQDTLVEVTEGVKAGDLIVTAGQNRLSNGSPVTLEEETEAADAGDAQ